MALPNLFGRRWMDTALEKRPTRPSIQQAYVGLNYFPLRQVYDYELTWDLIHAANHLAGLYAHDGTPIPGNDPDFETLVADVMHIMASRMISRNVIMKLRQAGELSTHNDLVRSIFVRLAAHVQGKLGACQDESEAVVEYLCLQSLQGQIQWPPQTWAGAAIVPAPAYWGNVAFTMSMGFPAWATQPATTLAGWLARAGGGLVWSNPASDPILDLEVIAELIQEQTGISAWGSKVLMSRTLLSQMAFNANILRWIRGDTGSPPDSMTQFVDVSKLKDYIATKLGYIIEIYDAQWTYETNLGSPTGPTENRIPFLRPGNVVILPPGTTGNGVSYFATAPDLGAPNGARLGLYTWSWEEERPPWKVEVGAGIHGFPILRMVEGIFVLNALA